MSSNGLLKERLFKYHFAGGEWRVSSAGEYRVSVSVVSRLFAFELFLAFVFPWDNRYTNTETSLIWNERGVAVCRSGVQVTNPSLPAWCWWDHFPVPGHHVTPSCWPLQTPHQLGHHFPAKLKVNKTAFVLLITLTSTVDSGWPFNCYGEGRQY